MADVDSQEDQEAIHLALQEMTRYIPRRPGPFGMHVFSAQDLAKAASIVWAEAAARGAEEVADAAAEWFFATAKFE